MRVKMNGTVVSNTAAKIYRYYQFEVCCPEDVQKALNDLPEGEELTLEVNSGGGSVFAGFEIYTMLRGAACQTVAEVQSLAGSAASTIACGCKKVLMSPVGQMMIHDPCMGGAGNIREHEENLQALRSIKESILNGYCDRCGDKASREQLRGLMRSETWLSAERAIELGLADGLLFDGDDAEDMVNAVSGGLTALLGGCALPSVEDLMARMSDEDRQKVGVEAAPKSEPAGDPAEDSSAWRYSAAVELEKMRF